MGYIAYLLHSKCKHPSYFNTTFMESGREEVTALFCIMTLHLLFILNCDFHSLIKRSLFQDFPQTPLLQDSKMPGQKDMHVLECVRGIISDLRRTSCQNKETHMPMSCMPYHDNAKCSFQYTLKVSLSISQTSALVIFLMVVTSMLLRYLSTSWWNFI